MATCPVSICFLGNFFIKEGGLQMEQWVTLIQDIGFPILVSFYLLSRIESKLDAIHEVLTAIKHL